MTCLADRQTQTPRLKPYCSCLVLEFKKATNIKKDCNFIFIQAVLKLLNTARSVTSMQFYGSFFGVK